MAERGIEIRFTVIDTTKFDLFEPIFEEEMTPAITVITIKVLADAEARAPKDRSFYVGSMQALVERYIQGSAKITGRVVATAPHAGVIEGVNEQGEEVEFGRRPGTFPNWGELRLWVERNVAPDAALDSTHENDDELIDHLTYAIGKAIQKRGLKPGGRTKMPGRPIGDAFRANAEFVDEQIQAGIDRTLNRL